jgi:hypothetical protein
VVLLPVVVVPVTIVVVDSRTLCPGTNTCRTSTRPRTIPNRSNIGDTMHTNTLTGAGIHANHLWLVTLQDVHVLEFKFVLLAPIVLRTDDEGVVEDVVLRSDRATIIVGVILRGRIIVLCVLFV